MNYRELRFLGHFLCDEDGLKNAQAALHGLLARQHEKPEFALFEQIKKGVGEFKNGYKAMADDILERARGGFEIEDKEFLTLKNAEGFLAEALGPRQTDFLRAGRGLGGMKPSDTSLVASLTGRTSDGERLERFVISTDHGHRR